MLAGPAGLAATRKLLRSVFYKGMSASIVEALEAARAAGLEDWLTGHIAEDLAKLDAATLTRIVTGTRQHAVRRGHEMAAAAEMLADLGVEPVDGRREPAPPRAPGAAERRTTPPFGIREGAPVRERAERLGQRGQRLRLGVRRQADDGQVGARVAPLRERREQGVVVDRRPSGAGRSR